MKSNRLCVLIIALLIIALIIAVFFNFFLFNRSRQYYLQLNLTRLDPLGIRISAIQNNEKTNSDKLQVIFLGDSRAEQWPEPGGMEQFEFINRGIDGQTSTQVVERLAKHIIPLYPDILLIQMCVNDLKTLPLFPHLQSWIISNCKNNIKWSVQEIHKQGAIVILTTIFPLGKVPLERRLFWSEDVGRAIAEVNQFIYSLETDNIIIFDTGEVLADDNGLVREEYSLDLLHLNGAGYGALNKKLVNILGEVRQTKSRHGSVKNG